MAWSPFGVSLELTATGGTVTRTSATQFTVKINASWETYYSGAKTNYGMTASSGGSSVVLNKFGTKASSGSGSFTGTYSISGYGSATKTITVTFRNYNDDNGDSATKNVTFNVTVPAWSSYTIKYDANGGTGAPTAQTKYKNVSLTLSSTKPTRAGYTFQGWSLTQGGSVYYAAGATCGKNENLTLYAVWKANTYTVTFNANGGSLGSVPSTQTKTYGVTLTLPTAKPTRTDYIFKGWGTSASTTTVSYSAGGSYTNNASITLYAIWAVGYTKPRITNASVARCDAYRQITDEGGYVLVQFDWETDLPITTIAIADKKQSETTWYEGVVAASGTNGTVNTLIKSGKTTQFDLEYSYQIRIKVSDGNVSDSSKTTTILRTIPSLILPIDVCPPKSLYCSVCGEYYDRNLDHYCGYINSNPSDAPGVSVGKTAEYRNFFDSGLQIRAQRGFYPEKLETSDGTGVDLDDVKIPNKYISVDKAASSYFNLPPGVSGTFTLEVLSAGAEGQIMQRLTTCSKTSSIMYERFYYGSTWGGWQAISCSAGQRLLHTDAGRYMTEGHTITLTGGSSLSMQPQGYLLVWSQRIGGVNYWYSNQYTFIPRYHLKHPASTSDSSGTFIGRDMIMSLVLPNGTVGGKVIMVREETIDNVLTTTLTGYENNKTSPNDNWVLRYVLGI